MKMFQNIVLGLLFALISSCSMAQSKVPTKVSEAFAAKFPDVKNVKWDKENAHEYEAEFKQGGLDISANFSDAGTWLETETEVAESALPEAVLSAFHTKYGTTTVIKEAAKIEKKDGTIGYEIEFKKGGKMIEAFFDEKGLMLK